MVRAPEYEEMDRARVSMVPNAFREVFGNDSGYDLKELPPDKSGPIACGPIERSTFHIYKGKARVAEIYQNGHIECFDDEIKERIIRLSNILEESANEAYHRVKESGY